MRAVEALLQQLDKPLDKSTKKMLERLIERKAKYDRHKNTHFFLLSMTLLYSIFLFYFSYNFVIVSHNYSIIDSLFVFFQTNYLLVLMAIGLILYGATKIFFNRKKKAEKEYEDLRCEIIERSSDRLFDAVWHERYKLFDQLQSKYDINLYHETK